MTKELDVIHNEDCFNTMTRYKDAFDVILTSPPYNTSRIGRSDEYNRRYDSFSDSMSDDEYIQWSVDLFNKYDFVLKKNGCILYNLSYSSEKPHLMWLVVSAIIERTNFTTADTIIWKKSNAIPNNRSSNRLTRITEYIFVFCRKSELATFNANKKVVSVIEKTGQRNYENVLNFIEAKNNDGPCHLNKATFSTDLCEKLLSIYAKEGAVVYDSFMGTGTTAVACKRLRMHYVGSELSAEQCKYAYKRIKDETEATK